MKSIIILVSLIVSAKCGVSLVDHNEEDHRANLQTKLQDVKSKFLGQNISDMRDEIWESIPQDLSPRALKTSEETGSIKPLAGTGESKTTQMKPPTSFNQMMERLAATRDNTIENARLDYEKVKKDVQSMKEQADMDRDKTLNAINEEYQKSESFANGFTEAEMSRAEEAKKQAQIKYIEEVTSFDEELKEAVQRYEASIKAAGDEYLERRDQVEEKKRNIESQYRNALEKAREEKETALRLAKQKLETAKKNNETAKKSKSAANAESEYQNELAAYQEAVKLAEDKWLKASDDTGIEENYKSAIEYEAKELEEDREHAVRAFEDAIEMHDKNVEFATIRKQEVNNSVRAEVLKLQDEYIHTIDVADHYRVEKSKEAWDQWKMTVARANKELQEAHTQFADAKRKATCEWKNGVEKLNEMKRKRAQKAKTEKMASTTPKKTARRNVAQNQGPKKPPPKRTAKKNNTSEAP